MSATTQLASPPGGELAPVLPIIPSQTEEGFFYPRPSELVPTQTIEAIGKIAGTDIDVECTIQGPANPADTIDEVPLLIAGGYFGPESAYDDYRAELAGRGKWAATWNAARSQGLLMDLNVLNVRHPQLLASRTALGVARAVQEEMGAEQVDGSGHSNGGQTVISLASHQPSLFRTITLKGSVGLDEHNLVQMIPRLGNFFRKDIARPQIARLALRPKLVKEEMKYFASNVALTGAEMVSAGSCDIRDQIEAVRQEHGIPVAAIQYQEDDFFPLEAVERDSRDIVDVFHIFKNPAIRHTGPQEAPADSAAAQLQVIQEMMAATELAQAA